MVVTDAQVRKLMEELSKHGKKELAAMRSGMDPKTARQYRREGKLPSEKRRPRTWQTREDSFAEVWDEVVARLSEAPTLEAKALFEHLCEQHPGRFAEGQLRTFQRRVRQWRAQHGPDREVFFGQEHRPGEAMQTDFTHITELQVTLAGEAAPPMLCHCVLPYSNWEWATLCHSESLLALRRGVQEALFRLGRRPKVHQTDNSTAATHHLGSGKRAFNDEYMSLMRHLGLEPRTIAIGQKHQNGDVEAIHGALKRRLEQHLLLRGSREFASVEAFEVWLADVFDRVNRGRQKRLSEEMTVMRPMDVSRLSEFVEERVQVSRSSTIRVRRNVYSVPSRLIGEQVRVRVYENRLEVLFADKPQLVVERLRGRHGHRIDYRHVIRSLVRKPGAFARYRYREDLFPSLSFRKAYDALTDAFASERRADMEYLRVLLLAASGLEADVEAALTTLLERGAVPRSDVVRTMVAPSEPQVPDMPIPQPDLAGYDDLLGAAVREGVR